MLRRIPSPEQIRKNPRRLPDIVSQSLASARELSSLGAFVSLLDDRALKQAMQVSARLQAGEELPLGGYVVAVKDNIAIQDEALTCGSKILDRHPATFTATVVERLEAAGAVIIGKTNLDEFAMGSSTENSALGLTLNPYDPGRVPGGSSGGSAVAVASGICHASLGSETGGSVRQPAAFCGICGLKPTYGRVSRYGLVAFGSSLDQVSPFAADCSGLFDIIKAISGSDRRDATSSGVKVSSSAALSKLNRPLRIGLVTDFLEHEALEPSVAKAANEAIAALEKAGHKLTRISLPDVGFSIPVYYIVATAEASSNLARFDGARYGFRSPDVTDLASVYDNSRGEGFGIEVRRIITNELLAALKEVDLLFTPTTPSPAFKFGEKVDDPIAMYLSDIFTVPANLAGIPALSVPWSQDENGLPIGLQLMGSHFDEELLLQAGALLEELRPKA